MYGNRGRACLALGSILRVYEDKEAVDDIVDRLHTWFEAGMHRGMAIKLFKFPQSPINVFYFSYCSHQNSFVVVVVPLMELSIT